MSGPRLTICRVIALVPCVFATTALLGGKGTDPLAAPLPAPSAITFGLPAVTYPAITPAASMTARNLNDLRQLKTATGSPRLPTPNPWFPLDLYQGTITRQQFEQKLHTLYDPFNVFPRLPGY